MPRLTGSPPGGMISGGRERAEAVMGEMLTIEDIKARYAPDWVLIGEPQTDEGLELRAGRVLYHGPDRDEVCRKAMEFPPGRYAVQFLGAIPDDLVFVF